jgi:hypothetical protein
MSRIWSLQSRRLADVLNLILGRSTPLRTEQLAENQEGTPHAPKQLR